MADVVETSFDVTFEYPLCTILLCQTDESIVCDVLCRAILSESERLFVSRCLCNRFKSQSAESLHRSVIHRGKTQRTFLFFAFFFNIDPFQRQRFVPSVGVFENQNFREFSTEMEKGDMLSFIRMGFLKRIIPLMKK